jgi:hypothetical protein
MKLEVIKKVEYDGQWLDYKATADGQVANLSIGPYTIEIFETGEFVEKSWFWMVRQHGPADSQIPLANGRVYEGTLRAAKTLAEFALRQHVEQL